MAVIAVGLLATGCGGTYRFSGTVTYDGKPLPYGEIMLYPDPDGGKPGPGVSIPVRDGEFSTAERGHVGGKYYARINGNTPTPDSTPTRVKLRPLFYNYEVRFELSAGAARYDFVVPARAAPASRSDGAGRNPTIK
jgi:hypothetical protein